jgi:hypothetical protein
MIELFVAGFALALFAGLVWAFKALPAERWQIAASIPLRKNSDGNWTGVNLTFYGMLTALSCTTAAAFLIVMVGAIGIELARVCFPSSRRPSSSPFRRRGGLRFGSSVSRVRLPSRVPCLSQLWRAPSFLPRRI